jgi:hypothetical protein
VTSICEIHGTLCSSWEIQLHFLSVGFQPGHKVDALTQVVWGVRGKLEEKTFTFCSQLAV